MKSLLTTTFLIAIGLSATSCTTAETELVAGIITAAAGGSSNNSYSRPAPVRVIDTPQYQHQRPVYTPVENYGSSSGGYGSGDSCKPGTRLYGNGYSQCEFYGTR